MRQILTSILTSIAAGTLLAAVAVAQPTRYTVTDLGTFGGTSSTAWGVNNSGRVGGSANLPGGNEHPFLSGIGDTITDLGTLGGLNGYSPGPPNASFQMTVISETTKKDPLAEDFCGFGTPATCLGSVWNGALKPLPNLGGNNSLACSINSQGEVIGVAETSTVDSNCAAPQQLDFEAALWGPNGQVQELPPLPGDTVGLAIYINDNGQVVGSSGTCANTTPFSGPHAVLWENGSPIALGGLGGTMIGVAGSVNAQGVVLGESDLASETPGYPGVQVHGFLWSKAGGMQDIGAVGNDFSSMPFFNNNSGQVVGTSCDNMGNCRAFLWQNKAMVDLNTLIPANSPLYLMLATWINDNGEIAGMAIETSTGDVHAFVATPVKAASATASFVPEERSVRKPMALPPSARKLIQKRLALRGW